MSDKTVKYYYTNWWHKKHDGAITLKFTDDTQISLVGLSYEDFTVMVDILRNSINGSVWYSDHRALLGTNRQPVGGGN